MLQFFNPFSRQTSCAQWTPPDLAAVGDYLRGFATSANQSLLELVAVSHLPDKVRASDFVELRDY